MTVNELIGWLSGLPMDAEVGIVYDGSDYLDVEAVWVAQSGRVLLSDLEEPVYDDNDRVVGAVSEEANRFISVAEMLSDAEGKRK